MTKNEILTEAQALLRKGWCQEAIAKTKEGKEVEPEDPTACAWCLVGAVAKASRTWDADFLEEICGAPLGYLYVLNDDAQELDTVLAFLEESKDLT